MIFSIKQNNLSTLKKTNTFQMTNFNKKFVRSYATEKTFAVPQMGDSITGGTLAEWVVGKKKKKKKKIFNLKNF